jgi:hypothetical protein
VCIKWIIIWNSIYLKTIVISGHFIINKQYLLNEDEAINQFEKFQGLFLFLKKWYSYVLSIIQQQSELNYYQLNKIDLNRKLFCFQLYSIYAKVSPEEVYSVLVKYNSSYIILEDSICMQAGRHKDRCSLPDTMDLTLGHVSYLIVGLCQRFSTFWYLHIPKIIILLLTVPPNQDHYTNYYELLFNIN